MFAGDLFFKDLGGEIRELTIEFLYDKILNRVPGGIGDDEARNLMAVISYYVQGRKNDLLVDEEELNELIDKLIPDAGAAGKAAAPADIVSATAAALEKAGVRLPADVLRSVGERMENIMEGLAARGLADLSSDTFEGILADLLESMGINRKRKGRLIFPIDEILLVYSKYSPFAAGDYFSDIVNLYLYNNFLLDPDVKDAEKKGILRDHAAEPFMVDRLDVFPDARIRDERDLRLARTFIFYNEELFHKTPAANKLLFRVGGGCEGSPSIVFADKYFYPGENVRALTFQKNENYSLFSLDETAFPVYPSFYNAALDFSVLAGMDSMEQFDALDRLARGLNRFYQKYSEYFYLVSLLSKRNLYMNIKIDAGSPDYNHLLSTYMRRTLNNEHIRLVMDVNGTDLDLKRLAVYASEGYSLEIRIGLPQWNERLFSFCKKNRVYLVTFDERGTI